MANQNTKEYEKKKEAVEKNLDSLLSPYKDRVVEQILKKVEQDKISLDKIETPNLLKEFIRANLADPVYMEDLLCKFNLSYFEKKVISTYLKKIFKV